LYQEREAIMEEWTRDDLSLKKDFEFADFKAAMSFIQKAGEVAEAMNHHPEWTNIYNKVTVKLTTHDAGRVTEKDEALAQKMDEIAASISRG
jgi:4a-hydroxytetrahydrobiopterin dehydratase